MKAFDYVGGLRFYFCLLFVLCCFSFGFGFVSLRVMCFYVVCFCFCCVVVRSCFFCFLLCFLLCFVIRMCCCGFIVLCDLCGAVLCCGVVCCSVSVLVLCFGFLCRSRGLGLFRFCFVLPLSVVFCASHVVQYTNDRFHNAPAYVCCVYLRLLHVSALSGCICLYLVCFRLRRLL